MVEPGLTLLTSNRLGDAGYIEQPVSVGAVFFFRIVMLTETEPALWYQRLERSKHIFLKPSNLN